MNVRSAIPVVYPPGQGPGRDDRLPRNRWRPEALSPRRSRALIDRLTRLAGRRRLVAALRCLLWLVVLIGTGLLLIGWVDLLVALPGSLRFGFCLGVFALGLGFTIWSVVIEGRRSRPTTVAREVDRLATTGGQVAAGLDLTALDEPREGSGAPASGADCPPPRAAAPRFAAESGSATFPPPAASCTTSTVGDESGRTSGSFRTARLRTTRSRVV